jgi:hypothetical protein
VKVVALVLAAVLIAIGAIWVRVDAPCGLWKLSNASDVPARCLRDFH